MSLLQGKSRAKTGRRIVIDLQKAERALKDGNHKEVEQLCSNILEERPDTLLACQLLAELRMKQGQAEEAMSWVERARQLEPGNARSLNISGTLLDQRGDLAAAEAAFRAAVEARPDYADALANLGHVLLRSGRGMDAEQLFRRAIQHDREHGLANLSLGQMLFRQDRPELAVPHLNAGIQRELSHRAGQFTLAVCLQKLGRLDEALTAYRRLVAAGDCDPDVYAGLAEVLVATGEGEVAMAGFEAALELDPQHARAAAGLGELLARRGQVRAALELLAPRVDRGDAAVCLHLAYARTLVARDQGAAALLHLADLVKRPAPPEELAPAHRLLGELLEERGEQTRAFAQFRRARRLGARRYDGTAFASLVERIIATCNHEILGRVPRGTLLETPVFLVGLPGSGTPVIERLVAAHSRAAVAGSLLHIDLAAARLGRYNNAGLGYPECLRDVRERDLRELAAAYLARLFEAGENARRIVDSSWLNILHLGLVELLFPAARVIHCRRNPLDVGLACYFHAFDLPQESFSGAMEDFGHFHAQYLRLMAHWRAASGLRILEVDFEGLAADPEAEGRRIVEFLGLSWEDRCAEAARPVSSTMLPERASGWSAAYDQHLGPLKASLAAAGWTAGAQDPAPQSG